MVKMPKELQISWRKLENLTERFLEKIPSNRFDYLLCISSGGLIFGKLVSDYLNLPLGIIAASTYKKGEKKPRDNEVIIGNTATIKPICGKVLLLDDLVDTGLTMKEVYNHVHKNDKIKLLETGVLYKKPQTIFQPNYWVEETLKWIVFPYERNEFLRTKK
jgi:hypoxanthine phosphoribosyltransferase